MIKWIFLLAAMIGIVSLAFGAGADEFARGMLAMACMLGGIWATLASVAP